MFEHSLIESQKRQRPKKRLLAIPVAIIAHLILLVTVVVAQYWTIEPVGERGCK